MAAVTASRPSIDWQAPATYPIKLGASILKPTESGTRHANVRYNHRLQLHNAKKATGSIKRGREEGETRLLLKDGADEYGYTGESVDAGDGYVLVLRGEGKDLEAVLESLRGSHTFNLTRTPGESDSSRLRERYPQLSAQEDGADGFVVNEDAADEPLDADNPYDYRHFLKAASQQASARPATEVPRSGTGTPLVQARAASRTPIARPAKRAGDSALFQQKKRKATPSVADRPNPKRAKAGQEAPASASAPQKPTKQPDTKTEPPPKIREDRKASLRRSSYDDSGELILENETPVSEKLPTGRSAMALALSGQLGRGPISLRSAASSPASRIASPAPLRPEGIDDEDADGEFEFGTVSSPEDTTRREQRQPADEGEDADMEDEDADVDDLELPAPAAVHKPSVSAATVTAAGEEDDLDAQLAAAMAEEEAPPAFAAEDEEESEEE